MEEIEEFAPFLELSIEEQLKKVQTHFGWSPTYLSEAVQFIDSTIGKLQLKHTKLPFGDLITDLGLQNKPILQILVDVQGIFFCVHMILRSKFKRKS